MKNPFAKKNKTPSGFDSYIAEGNVLCGSMTIYGQTQMNGVFRGDQINADKNAEIKIPAVLIVGGLVDVQHLEVDVLEVTGTVRGCKVSADTLIVRSSGVLEMSFIRYRTLVIETGARIGGDLQHLDADPTILREPSTD